MTTSANTRDAAMPRRAYSYLRFSHPNQAKGDSVRRQEEWTLAICQRHGWCLDDTLQFADRGKSAFHGGLKALGQFRDLVQRGRITPGSVLVVEVLDRLSREEVDDAYDMFREIIRAGIWIATREPERIYNRETSGNMLALLEPLFIFARAHEESAAKSMRIGASWANRRRTARANGECHPARPPAWIRQAGDGYELVPEAAALVQRIFAMARRGRGCGAIARVLRDEGVGPLGRCGRWVPDSIRYLLRGRQAMGEFQPCIYVNGRPKPEGPPIPGYYPAAVTEEEWAQTQAAMDRRMVTGGRPAVATFNLFTGLIRDADSGLRLALKSGTKGGTRHNYLQTGTIAGSLRVEYGALERCILDTLAVLRPADVLDPSSATDEREQRIATLTGRMTALDHRQQQLQTAAADPDQDAAAILPVLATVSKERAETARQLETLKLESLTGRGEALTEAQTLAQLRDDAEGAEREEINHRIRAALPSVVSEIWVKGYRLSVKRQLVHVQIWLRGGSRRDVWLLPRGFRGTLPDGAADADLRRKA